MQQVEQLFTAFAALRIGHATGRKNTSTREFVVILCTDIKCGLAEAGPKYHSVRQGLLW